MPLLIDAQPKDIHFLIDITLEEVKKLISALDRAQINIDPNEVEQKKAADYLSSDFYEFLCEIKEGIEGEGK